MSKTIPIYTASQSLNVKYHFENCIFENADIFSPGNDIHARLKAGYDGMLQTRDEQGYTASLDKINIATAAVTLLYADTSPEEGYLGEEVLKKTFALNSTEASKRLVNAMDLYNEKTTFMISKLKNQGRRDTTFNDLLQSRIEIFSRKEVKDKYDYPNEISVIDSKKLFKEKVNHSQFHETFHHSEQTIMNTISSALGFVALTKALLDAKVEYFYGMILDIYTERTLCVNCNIGLLGLQHSQSSGFLSTLGQVLEKVNIQPRVDDSMMFHTRVSATKACGKNVTMKSFSLANNKTKTLKYDPDLRNEIFQANNKTLGVKSCIDKNGYDLSAYPGGFFVSTQQKNQKKLVKSINKINPDTEKLLLDMQL